MNHKNFSQTTLAAAITDTGGTSITVSSSATFPAVQFIVSIDTEAMLVTNVTGTTWTVTRGYEGSTTATHENGATIYHDLSAAEADSIAAAAPANHTHLLAAGATDVTATAAELNVLDGITATVTELNYADGVTSAIQGQVDAKAPLAPTGATYTPATGAQTVALDVTAGNMHVVTGHAEGTAITFTITGATANQPFVVSILQGAVVSTIAAWFATIRWAGGTAPTLTATANKRDTFGFIRTGSATYDGFVIGQNA